MTEQRRLRRAHHHDEPALTVTTTAPPERVLDTLSAGLVSHRLVPVRRDSRSATLQLGSFVRSLIFGDSMLLDVVPFLRPWGMRATVDLRLLDHVATTQVRIVLSSE